MPRWVTLLLAAALPAGARPQETATGGAARFDPTLGGKLHLTYRAAYEGKFFRFRDHEFNFPGDLTPDDVQAARELEERRRRDRDHDLDQYLSVRTHDLFLPRAARRHLQGVDTELSVRWFNDLDGSPAGDESQSTYDHLDGRERLQFRTLNARLLLLEKHLELTGGRMHVEGAEWFTLDGARATGRGIALFGKPLEVTGFAGARVSFFSTVRRTTLWGGGLRWWPWEGGQVEVENLYFLDHTLQATAKQKFGKALRGAIIYRQIDEDPESVRVDLDAEWAAADLTASLQYLGKLGPNAKDFVFDYTTRDGAEGRERERFRHFNLEDLDPFDEVTLELRWEAARGLGLLAGATEHLLRGGGSDDPYNTDWYELWGGVDTSHVPWEGLTSRTVVRYVHTDLPRRRPATADPFLVEDILGDGEPSFLGLEFLIEQDLARRVAVGATLELRRYEYDSRFAHLTDLIGFGATAYARYRQSRFLSYSLTYAYDRDLRLINPDFEDVHGVRVEVTLSF